MWKRTRLENWQASGLGSVVVGTAICLTQTRRYDACLKWMAAWTNGQSQAESKEAKAAKPDDTEEDNLFDMIGSYSSKTTGGGAKGETEVVQKGGVIQTKKN